MNAVAISHDCQWFISASRDETLRLRELPSGKTIGQPLVGHTGSVSFVAVSHDDRFVVSGSNDWTIRPWDVKSRKIILGPLKHDYAVKSVCMSRDKQQIISVDLRGKVHLWSVSTGELLNSATGGPGCTRLLWEGRNGWNGGEDAEVESSNEISRIAVVNRDVYICEPTKNGNVFEKAGQVDVQVEDWDIDARGGLWACLMYGKVARLKMFTGSSSALENRENKATI